MTIFMSFQGFTEKITAGSARFAPAVSIRTWVRSPPLSNRQMLKVGGSADRLYHIGCKIRIPGCVRKGLAPSRRGDPATFRRAQARLQCRFGGGEQPSILRIQFQLSHRPAVVAVDQDGRDLLRMPVKLLTPLPQSDQDRENPVAFRRQ